MIKRRASAIDPALAVAAHDGDSAETARTGTDLGKVDPTSQSKQTQ